jgi:hypothetical protein
LTRAFNRPALPGIDCAQWAADVQRLRAEERTTDAQREAARARAAAAAERDAVNAPRGLKVDGGRHISAGAPWPRGTGPLVWGMVEPRDADPLAWAARDGAAMADEWDAHACVAELPLPPILAARLARVEAYCATEAVGAPRRVQHVARVRAFAQLCEAVAAWREPRPLPSPSTVALYHDDEGEDAEPLRTSPERPWDLAPELLHAVRTLAVYPASVWRPAAGVVRAAIEESGRPTPFGCGLLRALFILWRTIRPDPWADANVFACAAWVFAWACAPAGTALARATLGEVVSAYDDEPPWEPGPDGAARRVEWWRDADTKRAFMAGVVWAWWPVAPRLEDLAPEDAGTGVLTWDALPANELEHALRAAVRLGASTKLFTADAVARAGPLAGATLPDVYGETVADGWAALAAVLPPRAELQRAVYGGALDSASVAADGA